jgi:hypothetical protein
MTPIDEAHAEAGRKGSPPFVFVALSAALAVALVLGLRRVWDVDYWWQAATGRWIVEHGRVSPVDVFTWTRAGTARIESSWLWCVGVYAVTSVGGVALAVVLKALAMAWAVWVFVSAGGRRAAPVAAAAGVLVAALASSQRFVLRPEVVTYVLLGVFVWVIVREMRSGGGGGRGGTWVWGLPVLMAVWANCHSGFGLGLLAVGAWGVDAAVRAWMGRGAWREVGRAGAVLGLCVVGTWMTPYGWGLWSVAVDHARTTLGGGGGGGGLWGKSWVWWSVGAGVAAALVAAAVARRRAALAERVGRAGVCGCAAVVGVLAGVWWAWPGVVPEVGEWVMLGDTGTTEKAVITELASPLALDPGFTAVVYLQMLMVLTAGAVLWAGGRVRVFWVVMLGAGLVLGLTAVRNVPVLALVCAAVMVSCAGVGSWRGWMSWARVAAAAGVTGLAVFQVHALVTDRFHVVQGDSNQFGVGIARHQFAVGPARFVRSIGVGGEGARVFNASAAGGVLAHAGVPVFIDPRFVSGTLDEYMAMMESPEAFAAGIERGGIGACVLTPGQALLAAEVLKMAGWRLAYADTGGMVLLREGVGGAAAGLDLVSDGGAAWLEGLRAELPMARAYRGRWSLGRVSNPSAYLATARMARALGALVAAQRLYEDAYTAFPPLWRSDSELLDVADRTGDYRFAASFAWAAEGRGEDDLALEWVERALVAQPGDGELIEFRRRVGARLGPVEGD